MLEFNTIITEGEKTYLFAENDYNRQAAKIDELQALCAAIPSALEGSDLEVDLAAVKAIYHSGGVGLQNLLESVVIANMERLKLPSFMRSTYMAGAKTSLSQNVWQRVHEIYNNIRKVSDAIPVDPDTDLHFENGVVTLDADAIRERMRPHFSLTISNEDKDNAAKILELAAQVRELELSGLNALELLGMFYKEEETPAPSSLSVLRPVVLKRHKAGKVESYVCMPSWDHAQMYTTAQ